MKKFVILIFMILLFLPVKANAQRGCCSHHGGVAGCSSNGRQICNDGTLSPSCTCTPVVQYVYGCTDSDAKNYNSNATKDDGSCQYYIYGCTDDSAKNYNIDAEKDDGSCEYNVENVDDDEDVELYPVVNNDAINSESNEEASNNGSGAIFYLIGGGVLATYLYKRKKKD